MNQEIIRRVYYYAIEYFQVDGDCCFHCLAWEVYVVVPASVNRWRQKCL